MIYLGTDSPHHTALGDLCQPDSVAKCVGEEGEVELTRIGFAARLEVTTHTPEGGKAYEYHRTRQTICRIPKGVGQPFPVGLATVSVLRRHEDDQEWELLASHLVPSQR